MDSSAGEPFSPSNTSDINYPIPKDRYLEPIRYNSNPATIPGIMYDIHQWIARTGHFKTLLEHRAVALSNGALAIDQTDSIQFIDKQLLRAEQHDFFNPCPATEVRIANYNIKQATYPRPTPYTPTNTPVPKDQSRNYVVSSHKVDDQLRMLMSSMAHVFEDRDAAHAIIEQCNGDGTKFLEIWREQASRSKPSDLALVTSQRDAAYTCGIVGELTFGSLNEALKNFLKIERTCPPELRKSEAERTAFIVTKMLTDVSTRSAFEQLLMVASPPIEGFDATLEAARSMLRTRQTYSELDAVKTSSSQFGGMQALSVEQHAALASVRIDAKLLSPGQAAVTADAVIAQQTAAFAAGDPPKTDAKGKGGKGGKGSKGKGGKGKGGKGKSKGPPASTEFVIPRDENGKVNGWVLGMSPCWCKQAGLDDGKHIFDHCKYDENGKLKVKTANVADVSGSIPVGIPADQMAAFASIAKKFMDAQPQAASDDTSATQHAKSAVVTPPEDIESLMDDDTVTEQLRQFYALSTEQKAAATKVKTVISNIITIFLWSLVALTVIAAVVAGLHFIACGIPGSNALSQMNSAHLEVPISHYNAFPWITWILFKATERLTLVWQYYNLWLGYIFYFIKVNARIALTLFGIYFFRRDLACAGSHILHVLHSTVRPLRSAPTITERTNRLERTVQSLTRISHTFPRMIGCIILLSGLLPGALGHPSLDHSSPSHGLCINVNTTGIQHIDLPVRGANYNPFDASATKRVDNIDEPSTHTAFLREQLSASESAGQTAVLTAMLTAKASKSIAKGISPLTVFHAALDSGCTGSCTGYIDRLINLRPCKEVYSQANGRLSYCHWKGDMPVYVKTSANTTVSMTISNVRYVPDFKYTLLSVKQLWREQNIDARFRDLNHLELPSGKVTIPFDIKSDLPIVTLSSAAPIFNRASKKTHLHNALVGFHSTKSVSHIAKLSSSQAGQLMHRRGHGSIAKIRATVHTSADAPINLASAPPISCVHCASAQMRRTAHSGHLHVPTPEPGDLHVDLKEMKNTSLFGAYRYAAFFIDEHTRFVTVEFLKTKDEVINATKRAIAKFDALVGIPVGEDGKPLSRPKVRRLHRDHEGQLESFTFDKFRAEASLHSTTSPPHDHNLNPIAESTIRTIDVLATTFARQAGAPPGFWPEAFRHAVDFHNSSSSTSVGSSTADSNISPYQRFTLKQPKIMDLCTFGTCAVVLKPPQHVVKGGLSPRGWVGIFLGRCTDSPGCWEVWVPEIGRKVRSSSVMCDEERFPWLGKNAYCPLSTPERSISQPSPSLGGAHPHDHHVDAAASGNTSINDTPKRHLKFLNLFSGPYVRAKGLSDRIKSFGWNDVTNLDNDVSVGGGWADDLMNDAKYALLMQHAKEGNFDSMMIAFPCTTFSIARFFDATDERGDRGPTPIRDRDHPDGLPEERLTSNQVKELRASNRLLDRTIDLAIAARLSPGKTTIVFENPADRTVRGTPHFMEDIPHGSLFATSHIKRFKQAVGDTSEVTFAYCRFGGDSQKYTTLLYTNDAATVLDQLSGPEYQCNHPPRSHKTQIAGGRTNDGWASAAEAAYPEQLCVRLAMAFTCARTGQVTPLLSKGWDKSSSSKSISVGAQSSSSDPPKSIATDIAPELRDKVAQSIAGPQPTSPTQRSPISFRGFEDSPSAPSSGAGVNLGAGVPTSIAQPHVMGRPDREVRTSIRDATNKSLDRFGGFRAPAPPREQPRAPTVAVPSPIIESPQEYTSFTGTPVFSNDPFPSNSGVDADDMEATVADLIYASSFDESPVDAASPMSDWFDYDRAGIPVGATQINHNTFVAEVTAVQVLRALLTKGHSAKVHHSLLSVLHALRADSADAPETHGEAVKLGPPWPAAISKEFANHEQNASWRTIPRSEVPCGRRIHKFVWVFKLKRDGTAKARLCVQGCTLEAGVDYDQTFSKTLSHHSARGLFAYAARERCSVRSVDYVAAYLQGEFIEGEVVYCLPPPGAPTHDSAGRPLVCVVEKPIYGIPQAGRRLQRKVFPWCTDVMGLRQLDDSDSCVFIYDDPSGAETFAVGIYVDNLQIVHSAELNSDGDAVDQNSYYAKFMQQLRKDWDIVDEGPMEDLLGIECNTNPDGSITLHQNKYINSMINRFFSPEEREGLKKASTPYSTNLAQLVIEALEGSTASEPGHPDLVKEYQRMVGSLMYCCTATRPDLAYAVHQHCRALSRPTPELVAELRITFAYLNQHPALGLTFEAGRKHELSGYSDSDWAIKNSTSGWVIFWQSAPLVWGSRKQNCVALSSCEAEIIALSEAAKDMVYLRKFISGMTGKQLVNSSVLRTDNKAARDLSYNPELHNRTKHVARRHFFIRDMVEAFELNVPLISTVNNYADFFTKTLKPGSFSSMRNKIMNIKTG